MLSRLDGLRTCLDGGRERLFVLDTSCPSRIQTIRQSNTTGLAAEPPTLYETLRWLNVPVVVAHPNRLLTYPNVLNRAWKTPPHPQPALQ
jgi:hypothetical protein